MKVLLYSPKSDVGNEYLKYSLGILYIASSLKDEHEVRFYDENVDNTNLDQLVSKFDPDIIGVSFTTGSKNSAFRFAKKYPERFLIAGGFHPSCRSEECLDNGFDSVLVGEGELTFPRLLYEYERGKNIQGVYYGEKIKNLDDISFPARELISKKYFEVYDQAAIIGSRGCHSSCKFCGSAKSGLRLRSPKNIVSELEEIIKYQPGKPIHFCDDNFTINPLRTESIAEEIIRSGLKINYSINSRVDVIDRTIFRKLKESGCDTISFGIESGSQGSLRLIGKNISIDQIKKSVLSAKDAGLLVRTNWIVGLPGNYEEELKSIELMKELLPHQVIVSINTPYPGTIYGDNPEKFGIRLKTDDWTDILNNTYSGDFRKAISFDYLSDEEIFDLVGRIRKEVGEKGVRVKTFIDKDLLQIPYKI